MKVILDKKVKLSALAITIRELHNEGYDVVSVAMIAERHRIDERKVLRKMCELHKELRAAYPLISTQLVSWLYLETMPDFKKFNGYRLPPKSKTEIDAVAYTKMHLAIGQKAYGIRFITERNDFLCRVWEDHFLSGAATGFLVSRIRSTAQAAENRHIPAREAANNIVGAVLAIGPAINGSPQLPPELKQIKQKAEETFSGAWEKNFNKSRKGAWRL